MSHTLTKLLFNIYFYRMNYPTQNYYCIVLIGRHWDMYSGVISPYAYNNLKPSSKSYYIYKIIEK